MPGLTSKSLSGSAAWAPAEASEVSNTQPRYNKSFIRFPPVKRPGVAPGQPSMAWQSRADRYFRVTPLISDDHRLRVHELPDAELAQLPPVSRALDPAE